MWEDTAGKGGEMQAYGLNWFVCTELFRSGSEVRSVHVQTWCHVTMMSPMCHLCVIYVTCVSPVSSVSLVCHLCSTCASSVVGYIVVYNVTIEVSVCHVSTQMISIHY